MRITGTGPGSWETFSNDTTTCYGLWQTLRVEGREILQEVEAEKETYLQKVYWEEKTYQGVGEAAELGRQCSQKAIRFDQVG